jgi:hypothetical protein
MPVRDRVSSALFQKEKIAANNAVAKVVAWKSGISHRRVALDSL